MPPTCTVPPPPVRAVSAAVETSLCKGPAHTAAGDVCPCKAASALGAGDAAHLRGGLLGLLDLGLAKLELLERRLQVLPARPAALGRAQPYASRTEARRGGMKLRGGRGRRASLDLALAASSPSLPAFLISATTEPCAEAAALSAAISSGVGGGFFAAASAAARSVVICAARARAPA